MKRITWTTDMIATLTANYATTQTSALAAQLGIRVSQVYHKANRLDLKKSPEFLASEASGRLTNSHQRGKQTQFTKGQHAWNKGKKGLQLGGQETQFKKGTKPHNAVPVGAERINQGIRQRKISDTGYTPRDWKAIHAIVWEQHNGAIPAAHVVIFKDGNRDNITIENLELVTRGELMRRNSHHTRYPKEISEVIQLRGALTRRINNIEKQQRENHA
jgi:hypothetical protein